MTSRKDCSANIRPYTGKVSLTNNTEISAEALGMLQFNLRLSTGQNLLFKIPKVLYVLGLKGGNLISESSWNLKGIKLYQKKDGARFK